NPLEPNTNFKLKIDRLPKNSGGLLNLQKLDDVSRDTIALLTPEKLYELSVQWAHKYDTPLATALEADPDYTIRALSIERQNSKRKDIAKLSELRDAYGFFFDDIYDETIKDLHVPEFTAIQPADRAAIMSGFLASYNPAHSQEQWFETIKAIGEPLG